MGAGRHSPAVAGVLGLLVQFHDALDQAGVSPRTRISSPSAHVRAFDRLLGVSGGLADLTPREAVRAAARWWASLGAASSDPLHLGGVATLLRNAADALRKQVAELPAPDSRCPARRLHRLRRRLRRGPHRQHRHGPHGSRRTRRDRLSRLADRQRRRPPGGQGVAADRALYDTMFQYVEGDRDAAELRRRHGGASRHADARRLQGRRGLESQRRAGRSADRAALRALRARGVRFAFFHKLERIELTPTARRSRAWFRAAGRHFREFRADVSLQGSELLARGPPESEFATRARPATISRRAGAARAGRELRLEQGTDFSETAILAIPLGAFKALGGNPDPATNSSAPVRGSAA